MRKFALVVLVFAATNAFADDNRECTAEETWWENAAENECIRSPDGCLAAELEKRGWRQVESCPDECSARPTVKASGKAAKPSI